MDIVYYATGILTTLLFAALVLLTVFFLLKPQHFDKRRRIKKEIKRRHILVTSLLIAILLGAGSGAILHATKPPGAPLIPIGRTVVKMETRTEEVPFDSTTQQTDSLKKGVTQVSVQGVNGERTIIYQVTYVGGVETNRKITKNEVTMQPVTQVTQVGTYVAPTDMGSSSCNPNYTPCVPNVPYPLTCKDIGFKVKVIGVDQYHFDTDGDGYGCESYK